MSAVEEAAKEYVAALAALEVAVQQEQRLRGMLEEAEDEAGAARDRVNATRADLLKVAEYS